MKRRILLSAVALVGLSGTAFMACSSTQPVSSCVIQTTARGGPGFYAKYTYAGSTPPAGCEFLGTAKEGNNIVVGEEIGVGLYGAANDVTIGVQPISLQTSPLGIGSADVAGKSHIALGKFNSDPSQCTATTLSPAVAEIPDPGGSANTVIATYTFSDLKFVQAANIPGTQWGGKLHYHHETADNSVPTCDVQLDVQAVWYASAGSLPDGGSEVQPDGTATGNSCTTNADCSDPLFSLPGGKSNFECVPFLAVFDANNTGAIIGTAGGAAAYGGPTETGRDGNQQPPSRCVPIGSVLPGGKGAIND